MDTFEEFLASKCPSELIMNNSPEGEEMWIEQLDVQELIDFGDDYGKYIAKETALNIVDEISKKYN